MLHRTFGSFAYPGEKTVSYMEEPKAIWEELGQTSESMAEKYDAMYAEKGEAQYNTAQRKYFRGGASLMHSFMVDEPSPDDKGMLRVTYKEDYAQNRQELHSSLNPEEVEQREGRNASTSDPPELIDWESYDFSEPSLGSNNIDDSSLAGSANDGTNTARDLIDEIALLSFEEVMDLVEKLNTADLQAMTDDQQRWFARLRDALRINARTKRFPNIPWKVPAEYLEPQQPSSTTSMQPAKQINRTERKQMTKTKNKEWHETTLSYLNRLLKTNGESGMALPVPWRTPQAWLSRDEFKNHVNSSIWMNYPRELFVGADDSIWDEDLWYEECAETINRETGYVRCCICM
jgi:hypothetical protein